MWQLRLPARIKGPLTKPRHASGRNRALQYEDEEDVIVWVNTVGPYNNRQETYSFYQLPYCRGQEVVEHHHETLGEVLQGMELINAGIGMQFKSAHRTGPPCPSW